MRKDLLPDGKLTRYFFYAIGEIVLVVHGISNLYVAGSGCYVTSAAPNPTLTLVAISLRLSDFVKSKMIE